MQAIGEHVLVIRPRVTERKQGSIIIPNSVDNDFFVGEILSIGSDIEDLKMPPGSKVLVNNHSKKLKLGDKTDGEVLAVEYEDIITVVEDGEV